MSTTTPAVPSKPTVLERIQHEVVIVAGVIVAVAEALATALPSGPVHTILVTILPLIVGFATRARTVSLNKFEQLIATIRSTATSKKP